MGSRACVRVGNMVMVWFTGKVGLSHGYVMSPWLLILHRWSGQGGEGNVYMNGVVK